MTDTADEVLFKHAVGCDLCDFDWVCDVFKRMVDEKKKKSAE